jgi:hypothetical protein
MAIYKIYVRYDNDSKNWSCYINDGDFIKFYNSPKKKSLDIFFNGIDIIIPSAGEQLEIPSDCFVVNCAHYPRVADFVCEKSDSGDVNESDGLLKGHATFYQNSLIKKSDTHDLVPIIHLMADVDVCKCFRSEHDDLGNKSRYINIIDSSIWNIISWDKDTFVSALEEVEKNYKIGYYNLAIANEYADLNARLVRESYIWSPTGEKAGHGDFLSPFVFHSERQHREILTIKERDILDTVKKHKWRFLLLDDKCNDFLSVCSGSESLNKTHIICDRLQTMGFKVKAYLGSTLLYSNVEGEADIAIECFENTKTAIDAMRRREYDIILLDYLLGSEKDTDGKKHYGYELLTQLKEELESSNEIKPILGPNRKYFFMFISAFTISVDERLRQKGIFRSDEYWYIGEGSCPTNTPHLFMHQLARLMFMRLEDCGISKLLSVEIRRMLNDIYGSEQKRNNVKAKADASFHDILSLLYSYKRLLKDVNVPYSGQSLFDSSRSVLCTDFVMRHGKQTLGGLLEHVTHMVYLTAFGTVRQWPEIWEEYRFVAAQVGYMEVIESYILSLKSDS